MYIRVRGVYTTGRCYYATVDVVSVQEIDDALCEIGYICAADRAAFVNALEELGFEVVVGKPHSEQEVEIMLFEEDDD